MKQVALLEPGFIRKWDNLESIKRFVQLNNNFHIHGTTGVYLNSHNNTLKSIRRRGACRVCFVSPEPFGMHLLPGEGEEILLLFEGVQHTSLLTVRSRSRVRRLAVEFASLRREAHAPNLDAVDVEGVGWKRRGR